MSQQDPRVEAINDALETFRQSLLAILAPQDESASGSSVPTPAPAPTQATSSPGVATATDEDALQEFIDHTRLGVQGREGEASTPMTPEQLANVTAIAFDYERPPCDCFEDDEDEWDLDGDDHCNCPPSHNVALSDEELKERFAEIEECAADNRRRDEEDGLPPPLYRFAVRYSKVVNMEPQPLTAQEISTVIGSPVSTRGLAVFGDWRPGEITHTDTYSEVEIMVLGGEDAQLSVQGMAQGAVSYQGMAIIPGVGAVRAQGVVT